jgi:hypothetical protein
MLIEVRCGWDMTPQTVSKRRLVKASININESISDFWNGQGPSSIGLFVFYLFYPFWEMGN